MYKYETHLHTFPVSKCAVADVRSTLEFYKENGYDGILITNHFLDGNINIDYSKSYEEKIEFYFSDYEDALIIGKELEIKVFLGVEMSDRGTDFLVYGLDKAWYLQNPQIMEMKYKEKLAFLRDNGAYIVQAHPFREASYIDHIRLFPRSIDAVEIINACRSDEENLMAQIYARHYKLVEIAGSDSHCGAKQKRLAGIQTETSISDEQDFIRVLKNREFEIFTVPNR